MRKVILIVLGVLILVGAYFGSEMIADSKNAPKPKVKKDVKIVVVDTIQNATIPIIIPANGVLQAKKRVELYAEVSGVFKSTGKLFRKGQEYRAGQTMISIDNVEFYAQVQSARSNLNNQITAIMPDLRLDYPESFDQWQSYLNNWNNNASTPALPPSINDKEKYFITGRNIYTTYYNIKNLESRLGKYRITAPFSGVLTEAMVTEGTLIRSGQQLGEFIQIGSYEMQVAISSQFADLLKVGEEVELENITDTKTYLGRVSRVNGKIDQSSQTISTVIEVNDNDLKEGMFLTANLNAQKVENAVELDRSLIQNENQIFTVNDGKLKLITIVPIHFSDKTVVVKGITDGAVIISQLVPGAYEGMKVMTEAEAKAAKKEETIKEQQDSKKAA